MQVWEYPPDGTVRIQIAYGYEREGRIERQEVYTEVYHPFSVDLVREVLRELGYGEPIIRPLPYFQDKAFMDIDWYCLLARKK